MSRVWLAGVPLLVLILLAPMLAAVLLTTSIRQAQCLRPGPTAAGAGAGRVRVAQATLAHGLSPRALRRDIASVASTGADLVALQQVQNRTRQAITPAGYGLWRPPEGRGRGEAVLWRTDRWQQAEHGRLPLSGRGPRQGDAGATWVTLEANRGDGRRVSLVSVYHMPNLAAAGPDEPRRRQRYREAMVELARLADRLPGTVFLAGDVNSRRQANDPWGPQAVLGRHGWRSGTTTLGVEATHDGGGVSDDVFHRKGGPQPVRQRIRTLESEHRLLLVDYATTAAASHRPAGSTRATTRINSGGGGRALGLDATQWKRAAQIVAAGKAVGVPPEAVVIALAVASQESGFRVYANDGHGGDLAGDQAGIGRSVRLPHDAVGTDHGSLGLFQQQWPWWGTMLQLMDPAVSSRKFYTALLQVPGWRRLPLTVAAQRVQRSAHPSAYADDEPRARQVYQRLADTRPAELFLASTGDAQCATRLAATGTGQGGVVFPVPAHLADRDRTNWGSGGAHWDSWHTGTDFSLACGVPVFAAHAGTVQIDTTSPWAGPQLVKVTRGPGKLTTWYAHMRTVTVRDGQRVAAGEQLGQVGTAGNSTGCHLHFEVHTRGGNIYGPDNTDPSTWLTDHAAHREMTG